MMQLVRSYVVRPVTRKDPARARIISRTPNSYPLIHFLERPVGEQRKSYVFPKTIALSRRYLSSLLRKKKKERKKKSR